MNFQISDEIYEILLGYCDKKQITVKIENTTQNGREIKADHIFCLDGEKVRISVYDSEIIIGYFTDHVHFDKEESGCDAEYTERAKDFLVSLFSEPIRVIRCFCKDKLIKERYFVPAESEMSSDIIYKIILFGRKHITETETIYLFDTNLQTYKEM